MSSILERLKPTQGFSQILHVFLNVLLAVAVLIFIRLNFIQLAFSLVLLSKWRMVAVKPRFWLANFRANAIDVTVGLSIVILMIQTSNLVYQLGWLMLYIVWLLYIKPGSSLMMVALQAFMGQFIALSALYSIWTNGPLLGLILVTGIICYFAAHHFFDAFDEQYTKLLSYIWGYFGASLSWLLAHWLLYYRSISQPTLILSILGYGLALIYYLDHQKKLKLSSKKQIIFVISVLIVVILIFSNWGNKVI